MKKNSSLLIILLIATLLNSCDEVKYKLAPRVPFTFKSGVVYRKVLIEDYTGHKCGSCPPAALALSSIENIPLFGQQVVPIAVHAGSYAHATSPTFTANLQSTAGTDWDNTFGVSAAGNPNGLVNRRDFVKADFIKTYTSWQSSFASMDTMVANFQLSISNFYDTSARKLTTTVTSKAMQALNGTYNLSVVLTEDSIIGAQEDYSLPSTNQVTPNYVFNHVLRGGINGSWGDQVFNGAITSGQTVSKTYFNFTLPAGYKAKNCHVIAFIYDAASASPTYYEVFQVETANLY